MLSVLTSRPGSARLRVGLAGATLAAALSAGIATTAEALGTVPAAASAMAPVTVMGKVVKVMGTTEFTMTAGSKHYVVKVDAMTHVKVDGKAAKLSALAPGDQVTVKGPLEMSTITATSVTVGM